MGNIRIARQPIYDRDLQVFAYELLYRAGASNHSGADTDTNFDGDRATAALLGSAFGDLGIERLVGDKRAFINFTRNLLLGGQIRELPPEVIVVEVLEDIKPEPDVVNALRELAMQGYVIALDDFEFREELMPLVKLADIIKVDIAPMDQETLRYNAQRLSEWPVKLLAEKVETPEEYELCKSLGFDYFQGYFFCRPRVVSGRRPTANSQALMQLMSRLMDPEVTFQELAELAAQDPSLSYRLLKLVNSAHFNLSHRVESLQQAMRYLGLKQLRTWISFMLFAGLQDKPDELLAVSLTRARMCELMAGDLGRDDPNTYWTMGLLSTLDAFLDLEMSVILKQLPLSETLNAALLNGEGAKGAVLRCVIGHERADWTVPEGVTLTDAQIQKAYQEALSWAQEIVSATR